MATATLGGKNLRPPLKWAGGKRWLVERLRQFWASYRASRLVEPLCGGLAITLGLMPDNALLNDNNPHLINFFRQVSKGLIIDLPMQNDKDFYYDYRERFNSLVTGGRGETKEAAMLFYYLNRTGYNGLCRFNKKGIFNVPFGSYKTINYCRDFTGYKEQFEKWHFECCDFEDLALHPQDFIYADPPYDVDFTQYTAGGFNWHDQVRLAHWLAAHPGPVLLSNQATERIIILYESLNFELEYLDAPRLISCNGDRTYAREILALRGLQ
jgi:DNA adenine methylase